MSSNHRLLRPETHSLSINVTQLSNADCSIVLYIQRLQEQEELLLSSANKKKSVNKGQSEAARVEIEEINRELGLDEAQRKQGESY